MDGGGRGGRVGGGFSEEKDEDKCEGGWVTGERVGCGVRGEQKGNGRIGGGVEGERGGAMGRRLF